MAARLGPSSLVILGLLASAGPQTPYSLKQLVARTVGNYWPFPHAQIYAETARLALLGLASEDQEPGGLRRKLYAITDAGRTVLDEWLGSPTREPAQLRDLGVLKLAFGSLATPAAREALRADQVAIHERRLAGYARYAAIPMDPFLRATLELGLRYEGAAVDFWRTVALSVDADDRPA